MYAQYLIIITTKYYYGPNIKENNMVHFTFL